MPKARIVAESRGTKVYITIKKIKGITGYQYSVNGQGVKSLGNKRSFSVEIKDKKINIKVRAYKRVKKHNYFGAWTVAKIGW